MGDKNIQKGKQKGTNLTCGITSSERAKELGKKGGLSKGKNASKRREMKETLNIFLDMSIRSGRTTDIDNVNSLPELAERNITVAEAMAIKVVQKALNGDLNAFELIRDTIGERPHEKVEISHNEAETTKLDSILEQLKENEDEKWISIIWKVYRFYEA